MEIKLSSIVTSILLLGLITLAFKLLNWVWFKPKKLEKLLRKQGLQGNPYRLLVGDMKDLVSIVKAEQPRSIQFSDNLAHHILPFYHDHRSKYGDNSFVWLGPTPKMIVTDPQLMKEILTKPDIFQKLHPDPIGDRVVSGLLFLEDEKWTKHRRIINPTFHLEKLKNMVSPICLSCSNMLSKWEALVVLSNDDEKSGAEIDVWPYLEEFSGDVISRTSFGSSHEQGQKIFDLQKEQVKLILEILLYTFIPGWRYVPTKANRRLEAISKEIKSLLMDIIRQREEAMGKGEAVTGVDLLSTLMESNLKEMNEQHVIGNNKINAGMSIEEVIEECKLFYFAGSETTSNLLVWTMVMLSKYPEWQARARDEVLQVFGKNEPTFEGLNRLKTVTMILHEVLRLYTPVPLVSRAPTKTIKLGNITLPVGVSLFLLIGLLHLDPKIWGEDVNEFKPERFSEGISGATKNQFSYMPFSGGPRVCIGQQFAMIEAKLALAMILQRFSFELSSSYLHAPFPILTLQPQHGAALLLHKL